MAWRDSDGPKRRRLQDAPSAVASRIHGTVPCSGIYDAEVEVILSHYRQTAVEHFGGLEGVETEIPDFHKEKAARRRYGFSMRDRTPENRRRSYPEAIRAIHHPDALRRLFRRLLGPTARKSSKARRIHSSGRLFFVSRSPWGP